MLSKFNSHLVSVDDNTLKMVIWGTKISYTNDLKIDFPSVIFSGKDLTNSIWACQYIKYDTICLWFDPSVDIRHGRFTVITNQHGKWRNKKPFFRANHQGTIYEIVLTRG